MAPISIDGEEITGATIDGEEVQEITVDGQVAYTAGPDIPDSVLTQDLVAWYRFEDGDARDSASSAEFPDVTWGDSTAYNGAVNGPNYLSSDGITDFENGANSGVFNFDGANDFIDGGAISGAQFTSNESFTVTAWINPESQSSDYPMVISPEDQSSTNNIWNFLQNDNSGTWTGFMKFRIVSSSDFVDLSNMSVPLNEYTHISFGYNASTNEAFEYTNGVERDRINIDFSPVTYPGDWTIGAGNSSPEYNFGGRIDDVRIYNKALTNSEISDIFNATKP